MRIRAVAVEILVAVTTLAVIPPPPADLPDAALGSPARLYVERALATLALLGGAMVIGARAIRGELPRRLGQIEYESLAAAKNDERIRELEVRVRSLERLAGLRGNGRVEGGNGDL